MRKLFSELLFDSMCTDPRIWTLTGDLGFGVLDQVRKTFPNRSLNMGASEQLMVGAAVGLTHNDRIPICYSIAPFVIFRPYEWLRNYLNEELAPVKLVGAGRDRDYGHLGFSHWAEDDARALSVFPNIKIYKPETDQELTDMWEEFLYNKQPSYLNIRRNV